MEGEPPSYDVLFYDQDNHISSQLNLGEKIDTLKLIPIDPHYDSWTMTLRKRAYVKMTGLEHLTKLKKCKIDYSLINALIERWRPETNTFHFIGGEQMITLEDVSYLYGLPVDGKSVTGAV